MGAFELYFFGLFFSVLKIGNLVQNKVFIDVMFLSFLGKKQFFSRPFEPFPFLFGKGAFLFSKGFFALPPTFFIKFFSSLGRAHSQRNVFLGREGLYTSLRFLVGEFKQRPTPYNFPKTFLLERKNFIASSPRCGGGWFYLVNYKAKLERACIKNTS